MKIDADSQKVAEELVIYNDILKKHFPNALSGRLFNVLWVRLNYTFSRKNLSLNYAKIRQYFYDYLILINEDSDAESKHVQAVLYTILGDLERYCALEANDEDTKHQILQKVETHYKCAQICFPFEGQIYNQAAQLASIRNDNLLVLLYTLRSAISIFHPKSFKIVLSVFDTLEAEQGLQPILNHIKTILKSYLNKEQKIRRFDWVSALDQVSHTYYEKITMLMIYLSIICSSSWEDVMKKGAALTQEINSIQFETSLEDSSKSSEEKQAFKFYKELPKDISYIIKNECEGIMKTTQKDFYHSLIEELIHYGVELFQFIKNPYELPSYMTLIISWFTGIEILWKPIAANFLRQFKQYINRVEFSKNKEYKLSKDKNSLTSPIYEDVMLVGLIPQWKFCQEKKLINFAFREQISDFSTEKVSISDCHIKYKPCMYRWFLFSKISQRLILIDGCNVAMRCGGLSERIFNTENISSALKHFIDRGCKVIAFVPENLVDYETVGNLKQTAKILKEKYNPAKLPNDIKRLRQLVKDKLAILTPSNDYDDSYMLEYAQNHPGCCIVSNDMYRDYIKKAPNSAAAEKIRTWIKTHVISYIFAQNEFIPNPHFRYPDL